MQNQEASLKWCENASGETKVSWEYDDNFEWTGKWKTSDDEDMERLVDEDMGIHIELENLGIVEENTTRKILTADAMSTKSFDLVSVIRQTQPDSQQENSATGSTNGQEDGSLATAASGVSGGDGQGG